jgi:hypothetical protein
MSISRKLLPLAVSLQLMVCLHVLAQRAGAAREAPSMDTASSPPVPQYFRIKVIDQDTSRGIPCVKLQMTNGVKYWTDSAGVIAFNESDLMNQRVWFTVESHGYKNDNAPMGFNGIVLEVKPGGSAVVPMRRTNIAQRIYRLTGSGIYRDSLLLGDKVPEVQEAGKVPVSGQDGSDSMLFKNKLYWLWGDTGIVRFPLGVYQGTCAVSDLPGSGGLDPDEGVALRYFRRDDGDPRPIINLPLQPGNPYWYTRPRTVLDEKGDQHLLTDYTKVDEKMQVRERGLVEFNEKTGFFELVKKQPDNPIFHTAGGGTTVFRYKTGGREYFYNPCPYPAVRYPVDYASQGDVNSLEAFTCLKQDSTFDATSAQLDRDDHGNLRWGWKKNTSPVQEAEMDRLIKAGAMKPDERWYSILDAETGKPILSQQGSIYWNPYRQRWICIRLQNWGETLIGEVWYLEADTPMGPWVYARKIVSHAWKDHAASFYVPAQIPYFDKDDGRTIYFKGSFSAEFGDDKTAPPRDLYNVMMYKLDLGDQRLVLPVPVYYDRTGTGSYGTKGAFGAAKGELDLAWFAHDRPSAGTVPFFQVRSQDGKSVMLTPKRGSNPFPAFYAVPPTEAVASTSSLALTVPLYDFVNSKSGARTYGTSDSQQAEGYVRSPDAICRVWPSPIKFNPFGKAESPTTATSRKEVQTMSPLQVNDIKWSLKCVSPKSDPVTFAVSELRKYMKQITGTELPAQDDPGAGGQITIGLRRDLTEADQKELPVASKGYDGYSVSVVAGPDRKSVRVVIGADNDRAAIYATYDLLERMGYRWFYPQRDSKDPEVIRHGADARLNPGRWSVASPFRFRIHIGLDPTLTTDTVALDYDWALKCRYNTVGYSFLEQVKRRGLMTSDGGHCFDQFLKNEDYFKDHPEWFGLQNGKRVPQAFGGSQFCWSNRDARKVFVDNLEKYLREHTDIDMYGMAGGDGQPACTCAECARLNPSDWEILLVNEVIPRAKKICPKTVFMTAGAYAPCTEPPLVTVPDPEMACVWAHWGRHHGSSFTDERYDHKENLDSWSRIFGGRLVPFQYYSDHFTEPWVAAPYASTIMGDRKYLQDCNAYGFSNLMYPPGYWWNWGLNNYLAGICFYDPSADAFDLVSDYAEKYYGTKAGPMMAQYYREWTENLDLAYSVRGGATDKDRATLARQRKECIEPALVAAEGDPVITYRLGKIEKLHALAEQLTAIQGLQQESEMLRTESDFKGAGEKVAAARKSVAQTAEYIKSLIDLKQGLADPQLLDFFFPRVRAAVEDEAKAVEQGSGQKQEKKASTPSDQVPPQ